jgi:hypothetical protein
MSVTYRRHCTECEFQPPDITAGGFSVFVTNSEEDARRQGGETLPVVLHPLMPYVLDEFGLSYHSVAWGGQLVAVQNCVCRECGHVFEKRQLTTGGVTIGCGGCVVVAVLVFVVGAIVAFASGNPFIGSGVGVAVGVLAATGTEWSAHWLVRWRYPRRAEAVDTEPACRTCGSSRWLLLASAVGQALPCPNCGQRGQQFTPISRA